MFIQVSIFHQYSIFIVFSNHWENKYSGGVSNSLKQIFGASVESKISKHVATESEEADQSQKMFRS